MELRVWGAHVNCAKSGTGAPGDRCYGRRRTWRVTVRLCPAASDAVTVAV